MSIDEEKTSRSMVTNEGYNNAGILQIRLDTKLPIESFELYLRGKRSVLRIDENQRPKFETIHIGEPMANEQGIQGILQFLESIVNPQVVQGNLTLESIQRYCGQKRCELAINICVNRLKWGIKASHIEPICQAAYNLYYPFMTRPMDNKERESYANYVHRDSNIITQGNKSWFPNPFGGNK